MPEKTKTKQHNINKKIQKRKNYVKSRRTKNDSKFQTIHLPVLISVIEILLRVLDLTHTASKIRVCEKLKLNLKNVSKISDYLFKLK